MNAPKQHHVVIIGGGFGGLYAAQALKNAPVRVTLVDKRNFHLFQPLLYQVATGGLSPGDIASPLRAVLKRQENATVLQAEVVDIDPDDKRVILKDGELGYDELILAAGAVNHYHTHDHWQVNAPGLKSIEDALAIRSRVLQAFESAERAQDPDEQEAWLTFVLIGGGPTGVEMAGAIAELAHNTLDGEFRKINPADVRIILLEGHDNVLPPYPDRSSANARKALTKLGVEVLTEALATKIESDYLVYQSSEGRSIRIDTHTVLWAAGMKASPLADILAIRTEAVLDPLSRVRVTHDLILPGYPEISVIGDMAHVPDREGQPLPGIAPVAMQQGRFAARRIQAKLTGKDFPEFGYRDKGTLAVIGRNAAVAVFGRLQLSGFPAWFAWVFIHLWYLIEFDNKMMVMVQWAWNYFTRKRGARLITRKPNTGHELPERATSLTLQIDEPGEHPGKPVRVVQDIPVSKPTILEPR